MYQRSPERYSFTNSRRRGHQQAEEIRGFLLYVKDASMKLHKHCLNEIYLKLKKKT